MSLCAPVIPASDVALMDRAAVRMGCSIEDLMNRAGAAVASAVQQAHRADAGAILIACGSGNNGGDGYVAAQYLLQAGYELIVTEVSPAKSELCQKNRNVFFKLCQNHKSAQLIKVAELNEISTNIQVVIDAILGAGQKTGEAGILRPAIHAALEKLKCFDASWLSIDIPTGINDKTFQLPQQRCLCIEAAKEEVLANGIRHEVLSIGIPTAAWQEVQIETLTRWPAFRAGHKGSHGRCLIIGGTQFPGALHYAAEAASISACDLVYIYGDNNNYSTIEHSYGGIRAQISADSNQNRNRDYDEKFYEALVAQCDVICIGSGMGRGTQAAQIAHKYFTLAKENNIPCVIDADAIIHLRDEIHAHTENNQSLIITPHKAEWLSLTGDTHEKKTDIWQDVHSFAHKKRLILLKGESDFISDGLRWQKNNSGNPRMAMGGTGDCLAGLCCGLMARGASPFDAARLSAWCLCNSADELYNECGEFYSIRDILNQLGTFIHSARAKVTRAE